MKDPMNLLICYDGSSGANAAIDDLRRAGLPRAAQAIILAVFEQWLPHPGNRAVLARSAPTNPLPNSTATGTEPITETRALALEGKSRLKAHFPDWEIRAQEASGSPAREILKVAEEWSPDLIAVGSQGRSELGRFLLGSVSQKVANEALCSVRVARGTVWKNGAPVRILIALDGSPGSEAALHAVASRMWPPETEVRLTTVIDRQNGSLVSQLLRPADESAARVTHHEWIHEFIDAAAKKLGDAELTVSSKIEEGDPKSLIIANAEEWGAECIFIGASGARNSFEKFLLGSVATAIVSRAHCSVEIVRAGTDLLV